MDNSTDPEFTACGGAGYRGSDPARLCCALTRLSRALATCVPRTEMRIALTRPFCDCRGFRTEEIGWRSGDGGS
jgi:hypothetical protein